MVKVDILEIIDSSGSKGEAFITILTESKIDEKNYVEKVLANAAKNDGPMALKFIMFYLSTDGSAPDYEVFINEVDHQGISRNRQSKFFSGNTHREKSMETLMQLGGLGLEFLYIEIANCLAALRNDGRRYPV